MNSDIVARSILAALPDPTIATRGRYAGPRDDRAAQRRAAKALRPVRLGTTDPAGNRAERRATASPATPAVRLSPAERAQGARYRMNVALAACTAREAAR